MFPLSLLTSLLPENKTLWVALGGIIIGALILGGTFFYGRHTVHVEQDAQDQKQLIQKEKTTNEVNSFNDLQFCRDVLHGKLSNKGECM